MAENYYIPVGKECMSSFILYFLSSIKLNFKQMFYAFRVVVYNFKHVVDVMCGFLDMINTGVVGCIALNFCRQCFTVGGI